MKPTTAIAGIAPGAQVRERTLPVPAALAGLLPGGGLARGRVTSCTGPAAAALALVAGVDAVAAGSWLAAVSMPWLGVDAAAGLGLACERLVRVDVAEAGRWVDVVAAALDGFEIVVTVPPAQLTEAVWRKVQSRMRSKDAVLVTVGDHPVAAGDVVLHTARPEWTWARGGDHLRARRVDVEVSGRRVPRPRSACLWLPAPGGGFTVADAHAGAAVVDGERHERRRTA